MKFLDIKTDYAFKKVFGSVENKDILIEFLNSILDLNYKIKDLTITDPYNIPMLKGMKNTFVDVKALLEDDSKVIIEMQVLNHESFEKRVLYNMAKNYSIQLDGGDDYHLLNPVIAVTITNFEMFENIKNYISYFKLIEKREFIEYSDDIELIFIELPKFKKDLKDLKTLQDKYIYFIKNAGSLEYIPKELKELKKAFKIVDESNLTREELELQHKRREFLYIQRTAVEKAWNRGREEKAIEIAKNLLDILDDETISLKTGLEIDKIKKLRGKI